MLGALPVVVPNPAHRPDRHQRRGRPRSGFTAQVTVTNTGAAAINGWQLAWDSLHDPARDPGLGRDLAGFTLNGTRCTG
ncbi:hypothetical protein GCM10010492_58270 [Saccharothrix mutabilis subsp. mutabilis]|uniref:CBM2 domain-containing protein n=1 Tax=Saccharothrix mutabilis subsp. mutabilis TaxID=66855 RepID=A0ABP3E5E2_9PSEU